MQTFTFRPDSPVGTLTTRNPLVRVSDRIEAAAMVLVLAIALLSAPLAAASGTAIHDNLSHRFAQDRISRHQILATATQDSTFLPQPYGKPFVTTVRWEFGNGIHADELRTSDSVKADEQQWIWVDSDGNRTFAPFGDREAAVEAVVAAVGLWFATIGIACAGWALLRYRLNKRRGADWDRDLEQLADNGGRMNRNK